MWKQHLAGREIGLVTSRGDFDAALPSLLMIHGAGGRGEVFQPQLSGLAEGMNPAALDLPGHGATPGPGSETIAGYVDWLESFLAAGTVRPVLLGHSMGGAIAMGLALKRPELIRGLILVGTGARLRVMPAVLEGIGQDFLGTVKMIVPFAYGPEADPRMIAQGIEKMSGNLPEVLLGDFTACNGFDIMDRLGSIRQPTLVLVGELDKMSPVKYSELLAEAIPGAELKVIPGAGHMVYLEDHRAANQAIAEFMSSR
jgi:pimeloyl-ACP methyl ester carboxylesterase